MRAIPFFLLFAVQLQFAQQKLPQDYFSSPLKIEHVLSGTFAELRSNHFHSGVDIKTKQREGLNVFATANGYVSRIKISPWGYGKALYIAHPNGYTTVYAHLQKFSPTIEAYVRKQQYLKEQYAIELFPTKEDLQVTKDEIIAFSGNSGSSGGPHLHYEIRDASQRPMNPMLFGFKVKDSRKPRINAIYGYSLNDTSQIKKHNTKIKLKLAQTEDGNYISNTIDAYGEIGFGINTYDMQDLAYNKNGVYNIKTYNNGKLIYELAFKKFAFSETRYINRLIDYCHYKEQKSRIQKLYKEPNNPLSIIKNMDNKGRIMIKANTDVNYKIVVSDFEGNTRTITIPIRGNKQEIAHQNEIAQTAYYVEAAKGITINEQEKSVYIPKKALYDNIYLDFSVKGDTIKVHDDKTPLHKTMLVSFNTEKYKAEDLKQLFVAKLGHRNRPSYVSTVKRKGKFTGKTKSFGTFTLAQDSIAPTIKSINFYKNKWMSNSKTLQVQIKDDLSGIKKYRATVNGKWILMEYDAKNNLLTHYFSDNIVTETENNFKLIVIDNVGNNSTFETTFFRKQ